MAGKIFISYRRDDVPGDARGIRDKLAERFGKSNIFMDVDNLLAGQQFDDELAKALKACEVFIPVLGPRWMELLRLRSGGSERDYVREEIAEALKRKIVVIPVRVGREGQMPPLPHSGELPEDIRDLVRYQKHDVAHERFSRDIADLVTAIHAVQGRERPFRRWGSIAAAGAVTLLVAGWAAAYATGFPVWVPWAAAPQPVVATPTPSSPRPAPVTPAPQAQIASDSWRRADEEARLKVEQWERQMALATPPKDALKPTQSASDTVRAGHKRDIASLQSWADCNGITCNWTTLANHSPALKAIDLYSPATGVKKKIAIEVADSDVNNRSKYYFSRTVLMPVDRNSGLKISLTYYDGSTSEQRTILPEQAFGVVKLKALGQVRQDAPIIYGLLQHGYRTERLKIEDWVLIIDRPPAHHRIYYTVDDGGFFEATGQQYSGGQSAFANVDAITFKRPLPDKSLRMKFRNAEGNELGPFEYELDWEAIARKHFESYPQADPARAAGCQYFAGRPGHDAFALAMEGTQLAMTPFGFVKLGPEQIACTGTRAYGVREVRIGREMTSLTAVAGTAGYTVKDFLKGDSSSQRWQTTIEGPYADIYVQITYLDGKESEVVRTKPAKYCPAGARC